MKSIKTKFLTITMMLFGAFMVMAQTSDADSSIFDPANLVLTLAPFVVYGITLGIKAISPLIQKFKWAIPIIVVPALSTAYTWVSNYALEDDASFWIKFGIAMLGIVVHEVLKAIQKI